MKRPINEEINLLEEMRARYKKGENISLALKNRKVQGLSDADIIEISYDLQAGSYVDAYEADPSFLNVYTDEMAELVYEYRQAGDFILDAGCGELTVSTLLANKLGMPIRDYFAFDVSWSRLQKGKEFYRQFMNSTDQMNLFVAEMKKIPLPTKSIDILVTNHALEPNGADLDTLLDELIRVTQKKLILFEPCYENNSDEGRARMDKFGYIKGLAAKCEDRNCVVDKIIPMKNVINELNPTACFVISPAASVDTSNQNLEFTVPGTDETLYLRKHFLYTEKLGLAFPILDQIPVLKMNNKIIATAL